MLNYEKSLFTINGKHLMEKDVTPVRYIIDDLISAGVHILAGSPKIGKSWLSLWLCLSVANGTDVWGFKTHKGGVLYMALEDSENRLQSRLKKLNMPVPDSIHFSFTASDLDTGLLGQLEEFIFKYPDTSLIVIDTLQKIRGSIKEGTLYANDCKEIGLIKAFADKYNIAVVLVHHAKKGFEFDPQDSISGTNGIAGTADSNLILKRHARYESVAVLSVSGRDITSREMKLSLNEINCVWEKLSDTFEEKESERLSKMIRAFLEKEKTFVGTATELCNKLGEMFHENFSANSLGKKLHSYQVVMKKYNIVYDSTRLHDKRQISLTLNLPEETANEPDDSGTDGSVSADGTAPAHDVSQFGLSEETDFKEGQVISEILPNEDNFADKYEPYTIGIEDAKVRQIHQSRPLFYEDNDLTGETFTITMD